MKATHRLTYLPSGGVYLFHVQGDNYYLPLAAAPYQGPFRGFSVSYLDSDKWSVEKISTFKGNK